MKKPTGNPPVIIVGAHTIGLAVIRAFKDIEIERIVVSYDQEDMGRVSRYITKLFESPKPDVDPEPFIEFLIDLAKTYPHALLIPASDASLKAISIHKEVLDKYFTIACPEWEIIQKIIDKKQTYAIAEKAGIPTPRTLHPHTIDEAEHIAGSMEFPYLLKPCQSHLYFEKFRRKMLLVNSIPETLKAFREAFEAGLDVVLQEFIPGPDTNGVNYNCYFGDGKPLVEFTAKKIRNAPTQYGSPCSVVSAEVPQVLESGRKILSALDFYGYACTEFKYDDRDKKYKLMEVNGRHNLSGLLATICGINFPVIHYRHLMFGEIPEYQDYCQDIYWIDFSRDIGYYLSSVMAGKYPFKDFIKPYSSKHVYAIYDSHDMRPFLKRTSNLIQYSIKKVGNNKRGS